MKKIIASLLICILMVAMATGCSTASPTPTENIRITVTPLPTLTPMKFLTTEDKWNYVIENNVAYIDYTKCRLCRKCVNVCPRKAISAVGFPTPKTQVAATQTPEAQTPEA